MRAALRIGPQDEIRRHAVLAWCTANRMFLIYDLVKITYIARADWSYQASGGKRGAGSRGCSDGKMILEGVSYG